LCHNSPIFGQTLKHKGETRYIGAFDAARLGRPSGRPGRSHPSSRRLSRHPNIEQASVEQAPKHRAGVRRAGTHRAGVRAGTQASSRRPSSSHRAAGTHRTIRHQASVRVSRGGVHDRAGVWLARLALPLVQLAMALQLALILCTAYRLSWSSAVDQEQLHPSFRSPAAARCAQPNL